MSEHYSMPSTYSERVTFGLKLAHEASQAHVHELEKELRSLSQTIDHHRSSTIEAQKKAAAADAQLLDAHRRMTELNEEIRVLKLSNKDLTKRLEASKKLQQKVAEALESQIREDHITERPSTEALCLAQEEPTHSHSQAASHAAGRQAPGSQPRSIANSYSEVATLDGKAFFTELRKVISPEEFLRFLDGIKKLNNNTATREEVVSEASHIFGQKHPHLLRDFQALVSARSSI